MDFLLLLIIAILLIILHQKTKTQTNQQQTETTETPNQETLYPYAKKHLLSKAEYAFYQVLKTECDKYNLLICPKVRMEDFINVTDKQNYTKYRGYIKSRHIDFLLCDTKLQIIGAIELDDNSHTTEKAQKTDELKNNIFKAISLPLFRVKMSDGAYQAQIDNIIKNLNAQVKA